ncbi:MAG: DUF3179 domain-containing (seleno)protein [Sphingomonadales bacterium]|jgi:hypothetical protein
MLKPGFFSFFAFLIAALTLPAHSTTAQNIDISALDQSKLRVFGAVNTPRALDEATFVPLDLAGFVGGLEPVVSVRVNNAVKAYPVRILAVHAVVNDTLGGESISITYCGPCSSATVLKRGERKLRSAGALYDDTLLIADERGQGYWLQRDGALMAGNGGDLPLLNAKLISMARFRQENAGNANALVLRDSPQSRIPSETVISLPNATVQGSSDLEEEAEDDDTPDQKIRILGDKAWSLELLNQEKQAGQSDVIILWQPDSSFDKRSVQGPKPN